MFLPHHRKSEYAAAASQAGAGGQGMMAIMGRGGPGKGLGARLRHGVGLRDAAWRSSMPLAEPSSRWRAPGAACITVSAWHAARWGFATLPAAMPLAESSSRCVHTCRAVGPLHASSALCRDAEAPPMPCAIAWPVQHPGAQQDTDEAGLAHSKAGRGWPCAQPASTTAPRSNARPRG